MQNNSRKYFKTNGTTVKTSWNNNNGLLLVDELQEFEEKLDGTVKSAWNAIPGVMEDKKILRKESANGILSNAPMAFSLLEKIFPELTKLFVKNWYSNPESIFNNNEEIPYFDNMTFSNTDKVPVYNNNQYMLVTNMQSATNLKEQITENQYRIGYNENGNL